MIGEKLFICFYAIERKIEDIGGENDRLGNPLQMYVWRIDLIFENVKTVHISLVHFSRLRRQHRRSMVIFAKLVITSSSRCTN